MLTRSCQVCNVEYPVRVGLHTCSMTCRDERTRRKRLERYEDRSCAICGKLFNVPKLVRSGQPNPAKLCGMACVGENNRRLKLGNESVEHEDVACRNQTCGETIRRRVTDTKREFCSRRCRSQFLYVQNGMKDKLISKDFVCTLLDGTELTVRSRWEAAFIKDYLGPRGFNWEHESKIIDLPDGRKYIPDFYIADDGVFVEVKGFERGPSLEKVKAARAMGHHVIYADHRTLTGVFGLDLSSGHLALVARPTV